MDRTIALQLKRYKNFQNHSDKKQQKQTDLKQCVGGKKRKEFLNNLDSKENKTLYIKSRRTGGPAVR